MAERGEGRRLVDDAAQAQPGRLGRSRSPARAASRGAAAILLGAMAQEHERAAGAWHAEWEALRERAAPAPAAPPPRLREALDGLEVDAERMRENLEATGGLLLAESGRARVGERSGAPRAERWSRPHAAGDRERDGACASSCGDEPRDRGALDARRSTPRWTRRGYLGSAERVRRPRAGR